MGHACRPPWPLIPRAAHRSTASTVGAAPGPDLCTAATGHARAAASAGRFPPRPLRPTCALLGCCWEACMRRSCSLHTSLRPAASATQHSPPPAPTRTGRHHSCLHELTATGPYMHCHCCKLQNPLRLGLDLIPSMMNRLEGKRDRDLGRKIGAW